LAHFGEVVDYPRGTNAKFGIVWPSARARLKMLMDFTSDDNVLLYLDSDTLIYENLDKLVSEFIELGRPIAIGLEDIDEFWRSPVSCAWSDGKIPIEFQNQDKWHNAPMANAGVILAQGAGAWELGEAGMDVYEKYNSQLWLAEQTVINTLLYDQEIPYMKLPPRYNCFALEEHITHKGAGPRYVGTKPFFRGESVAIRHFAGSEANQKPCKIILDEALPLLDTNARLLKISNNSGETHKAQIVDR
jgi:lipopolysaccharide biosynthesis glycosyltransferase